MIARADTRQEPQAEDEEGPLLQQQHKLILPEVHQETTAFFTERIQGGFVTVVPLQSAIGLLRGSDLGLGQDRTNLSYPWLLCF